MDPTCEHAGYKRYACKSCDETKEEEIPALAHKFGGYTSNGDGTHTAVCVYGCGTEIVKNCEMEENEVNGVSFQVCKVCGYMVIANKAADVSEEALDTQSIPIEDVVAEPVDDSFELPESAQIVAEDLTATLFDTENKVPDTMVFTLELVAEGEALTLEGEIRVTIPMIWEIDLEINKLVRLLPNGGMEDIPFEYDEEENQLTFVTDKTGVFMFVPREPEN